MRPGVAAGPGKACVGMMSYGQEDRARGVSGADPSSNRVTRMQGRVGQPMGLIPAAPHRTNLGQRSRGRRHGPLQCMVRVVPEPTAPPPGGRESMHEGGEPCPAAGCAATIGPTTARGWRVGGDRYCCSGCAEESGTVWRYQDAGQRGHGENDAAGLAGTCRSRTSQGEVADRPVEPQAGRARAANGRSEQAYPMWIPMCARHASGSRQARVQRGTS